MKKISIVEWSRNVWNVIKQPIVYRAPTSGGASTNHFQSLLYFATAQIFIWPQTLKFLRLTAPRCSRVYGEGRLVEC